MNHPRVEILTGSERGTYRLLADFTYRGVTVPAGFETDLASWICWPGVRVSVSPMMYASVREW